MIQITVDQSGLNQLTKVMIDGVNALKDWSKPLKKFGVLLRDEQRKNFESQGAVYQGGDFIRTGMRVTTKGHAWSKLTEGTRKDRARRGYNPSRPILVRTGAMKGGFTSSVTKNSFTSENRSKIAQYHQSGTSKMPQRRIIGMSKKGTQALQLELEHHVAGPFKMAAYKSGFVVLR